MNSFTEPDDDDIEELELLFEDWVFVAWFSFLFVVLAGGIYWICNAVGI